MAVILVVEDDPHQCVLYEEGLKDDGYEVVTARDGREALRVAESRRPDLVVMDISMPGMDGIEAMSRMLSRDHKLPVILNTAYATYKDNFRSWSADAYVVKSSDMTELRDAVARVLKTRATANRDDGADSP